MSNPGCQMNKQKQKSSQFLAFENLLSTRLRYLQCIPGGLQETLLRWRHTADRAWAGENRERHMRPAEGPQEGEDHGEIPSARKHWHPLGRCKHWCASWSLEAGEELRRKTPVCSRFHRQGGSASSKDRRRHTREQTVEGTAGWDSSGCRDYVSFN